MRTWLNRDGKSGGDRSPGPADRVRCTAPRRLGAPWRTLWLPLAILSLAFCGGVRADLTRDQKARIPVILFDVVFDAAPPVEGPDSEAMTRLIADEVASALKAAGYDPIVFNPESPSIGRALGRDRLLTLEDTAHPERESSARKIAAACGARYVLFTKLSEVTLDLEKGQARVQIVLRVVPDIGDAREVGGGGSAEMKPDKRRKGRAARLLGQAVATAAREAVQNLSGMASGGSPASAAPREAQSYYAQAMEARKQNRLDQAIPLLERATRLDPQNVEYAVALGDSYQGKGQVASAYMEFKRAVTIQPASIELRVRLAKILLQRSMVREAQAELRRAASLAPENEDVRTTLVEIYLRNGMLEEALAECRRMVLARPDDAGIHVALGDLQVRRGELDEARKEWLRAAELDPTSPAPHERLADLYRKRNMHVDALRELLLAQRTPAGADDSARYRVIATALDGEAQQLLDTAAKTAEMVKGGSAVREDAYAATKTLVDRADALATEMGNLKVPAVVKESHKRRTFAYSLLAQCLVAYLSYYEGDRAGEAANADALHAQAARELQRARETLPAS